MTIWLFSKIRPWYYSDQTSYTRSPFTSFEFPAKNSPIITFNIWISRQKLINQSKGSLDFSLQNNLELNFGIIKDPSSHFFEFSRQNSACTILAGKFKSESLYRLKISSQKSAYIFLPTFTFNVELQHARGVLGVVRPQRHGLQLGLRGLEGLRLPTHAPHWPQIVLRQSATFTTATTSTPTSRLSPSRPFRGRGRSPAALVGLHWYEKPRQLDVNVPVLLDLELVLGSKISWR